MNWNLKSLFCNFEGFFQKDKSTIVLETSQFLFPYLQNSLNSNFTLMSLISSENLGVCKNTNAPFKKNFNPFFTTTIYFNYSYIACDPVVMNFQLHSTASELSTAQTSFSKRRNISRARPQFTVTGLRSSHTHSVAHHGPQQPKT